MSNKHTVVVGDLHGKYEIADRVLENNRFTEVIEEEVPWEDSLGTDKYKNGILCEVWDDVRASMGAFGNIAEVDASGEYHTVDGVWWGMQDPSQKKKHLVWCTQRNNL